MKKLFTFLATVFLSCGVLSLGISQAQQEPITTGKWGFGIRAGGSMYTQNLADDVLSGGDELEGDLGLLLSGNIMLELLTNFFAGLNVEWERHKTELSLSGASVDVGETETISIMPFLEARYPRGSFVPYGSFGVGININSFHEFFNLSGRDIEIKPDNTVAVKLGAGTDYFVTETFALNGELGWKLNKGKADVTGLGSEDFNASAFSFLFGVRYYINP